MLRPAIEKWAGATTKTEACHRLAAAGIAAGPCLSDAEVVRDPHVTARSMLVEVPRTDGVAQPVLVPASPVRLSGVGPSPEIRPPWLGEHTDDVLGTELGLGPGDLAALRADGVIA